MGACVSVEMSKISGAPLHLERKARSMQGTANFEVKYKCRAVSERTLVSRKQCIWTWRRDCSLDCSILSPVDWGSLIINMLCNTSISVFFQPKTNKSLFG